MVIEVLFLQSKLTGLRNPGFDPEFVTASLTTCFTVVQFIHVEFSLAEKKETP